ncbi:hypothetical protein [Yinghuangia soli]|uniref:Scramblase n=1 Tax=Yinghuangia soli TaxID=2908204 RepID=A0AA41Q0L9_9ACTN|nr:hypothetical protein [Yinghuangia soli]MCF2527862.1 hypothetical protein [Yinghuangia soli]
MNGVGGPVLPESGLTRAAALVVERSIAVKDTLLDTKYAADVYDDADRPVGTVRERRGPGVLAVARLTELSGSTPFDLRVLGPDGTELLGLSKGFSLFKPVLEVRGADGRAFGTVRRQGRAEVVLHDGAGTSLGLLSAVMSVHTGEVAKRDGKRVRRNVFRFHAAAPDGVRALAVGAAVAYDLVRDFGTRR